MKITIRDSKYRLITPQPLDVENEPIGDESALTFAWGAPSDPTVIALGTVDLKTGACVVTAIPGGVGKTSDVVVSCTDSSTTPPTVKQSTLTIAVVNAEIGSLSFTAGPEVDSGSLPTPPA